jgi:hypothetical protein
MHPTKWWGRAPSEPIPRQVTPSLLHAHAVAAKVSSRAKRGIWAGMHPTKWWGRAPSDPIPRQVTPSLLHAHAVAAKVSSRAKRGIWAGMHPTKWWGRAPSDPIPRSPSLRSGFARNDTAWRLDSSRAEARSDDASHADGVESGRVYRGVSRAHPAMRMSGSCFSRRKAATRLSARERAGGNVMRNAELQSRAEVMFLHFLVCSRCVDPV